MRRSHIICEEDLLGIVDLFELFVFVAVAIVVGYADFWAAVGDATRLFRAGTI